MNTIWTDVVAAYEKELSLLEEARAEYATAAKRTIAAVAARLRERELRAPEGAVIRITEESEKGLGRDRADVDILVDDVTLLTIQVYVASAYGGEPGKIRVAAYVADDRLAFSRREVERRAEVVKATGLDRHALTTDTTEEAVAVATFEAHDELAPERAAAAVAAIIEDAASILRDWTRQVTPVARARRALVACRDRLLREPIDRTQVVAPATGRKLKIEDGLVYVHLQEPAPSVWIGVRLDDGALVYAHDETDSAHTSAVLGRLNGEAAKVGEFAGGVLMSGASVVEADIDQIARRAYEAFLGFRREPLQQR